jgi:transglutaminase/protease-like cytokinesis protein 3
MSFANLAMWHEAYHTQYAFAENGSLILYSPVEKMIYFPRGPEISPEQLACINTAFTNANLTDGTIYDIPEDYLKKHDEAKAKLRGGSYTRDRYEDAMRDLRREPAGLYGGLVEGKSICAGYALILHEALKYVGIKSQYVTGWNPGEEDSHAWTQVQIDGKWYNTDPTWDSNLFQIFKQFKYMLLNDEEFDKSHSKFKVVRTKTYHKCTSKFDYSKIKGLSLDQIITPGKDTNRI